MAAKRKSPKRMISCTVSAHHRVEDFRPYKIHFADRGDCYNNLAVALNKAIVKEGEWNGWFQEDEGSLRGLEKEIERKVTELVRGHTTKEIVIFGYDPYNNAQTIGDVFGLAVWVDFEDKVYGFGLATRRTGLGEDKLDARPLSADHTDKYENRWVEF